MGQQGSLSEGLIDTVEGINCMGSPVQPSTSRGEDRVEGLQNVSISRDKTVLVVKTYHTQEFPELTLCRWGGKIANDLHFLIQGADAVLRDMVPEEM